MNNLIISIEAETKDLFTKAGVNSILTAVDKKIAAFGIKPTDTTKGREAIRLFAAKIVKTKTFLEKEGKNYVADKKAAIKIFDSHRKKLRDALTEKAAQAREPLTLWEKAEADRHEKKRQLVIFNNDHADAIQENILYDREKLIAEKEAEIAKREEEKKLKEREEQIKRDAAAEATRVAEAKLKEQEAAIEQAEKDRIAAEERAKIEQKIAVQKAKDEAERLAFEKEQARIKKEEEAKAKAAAKEKEAAKIAADKTHQQKINIKIVSALVNITGMNTTDAQKIVIAVVKEQVPNMRINY